MILSAYQPGRGAGPSTSIDPKTGVTEDSGTDDPGSGPDGNADYYEIGAENGRILAFSGCY